MRSSRSGKPGRSNSSGPCSRRDPTSRLEATRRSGKESSRSAWWRAPMLEQTLEQKRAAHALACVKKMQDKERQARYRSYAESLPATIVMSGLGQALATELASARGGESKRGASQHAHEQLFNDVQEWLRVAGVYPGEKPILEEIMEGPQAAYVRAQGEALAWLVWLKKFCQAFL